MASIFSPASPVPSPIPPAVADFKVRQMPQSVRDAVLAEANARRAFQLCRTEFTAEAREYAIADLAAATKRLAVVPSRRGGAA